jgi:uncharacterized membrane protein YphA (DoxX/SURF4 family)
MEVREAKSGLIENSRSIKSQIEGPLYAAAALLARLLLGAIFVWSGIGKLLAATATMAGFAKLGLPVPPLAFAVAVFVEAGVGAAFIMGFYARPAALVLAFWSIATAIVLDFTAMSLNGIILLTIIAVSFAPAQYSLRQA